MSNKGIKSNRIVKVPLPVALIRRMDEAVVGEAGGFRTRAELMQEAVENLLNELVYPEASSASSEEAPQVAPRLEQGTRPESPVGTGEPTFDLPRQEREELEPLDLPATALWPSAQTPRLLTEGAAEIRDEPLLGLHNRDYVSIWALHRLARYTTSGPIGFDEYLCRVTAAAWLFGSRLARLESEAGTRKLTILFPTNQAKRPSAERGFQSFAIGGISRRPDQSLGASGPLFAWRAVQVEAAEALPFALTESGWGLLEDLAGISLELPHPPSLTRRFLRYLGDHAPGDHLGFVRILRIAVDGPDREELVRGFAEWHPTWTPATASSVAQGYVARAREWGLLEPRLVDGRYWLTETGREIADEITENPAADKGAHDE